MRKILPFIILFILLLTSCMTSYTINPQTEQTGVSLGFGGSYIYHDKMSGFGIGFNSDISFEFFESSTFDNYMTFRIGPNIEYENFTFSVDFNVKYLKDIYTKNIEYHSIYNYMSIELGYVLANRIHLGLDFNAKKELTIFCRLLYKENHR